MNVRALPQAAASVALTLSIAACGGVESSGNEPPAAGTNGIGGTTVNGAGGGAVGGSGGASGGSSGQPPNSGTGRGQIVFVYQAGNPAQSELRAVFHRPSTAGCATIATHGDCRFKFCPPTTVEDSSVVSAGVVSATNAAAALQLMSTFDAEAAGGYADARQSVAGGLKAGEPVTLATTGAEAPAFSRDLAIVAPLVLVKPVSKERSIPITRQGVGLEWQPGDVSTTVLVSAFGGSAEWTALECSWPANLGSGSIPADALAQLADGEELSLAVRRRITEVVEDFTVNLSILTGVRTETDPLPHRLVLTDAL